MITKKTEVFGLLAPKIVIQRRKPRGQVSDSDYFSSCALILDCTPSAELDLDLNWCLPRSHVFLNYSGSAFFPSSYRYLFNQCSVESCEFSVCSSSALTGSSAWENEARMPLEAADAGTSMYQCPILHSWELPVLPLSNLSLWVLPDTSHSRGPESK